MKVLSARRCIRSASASSPTITMGVTGADDDNGIAYFIFAAPGLVGVGMSVYYLRKKTVEAPEL